MSNVIKYESYKKYLKDWIGGGNGKMADLARGAGCHRTYLSQVLHGKADLTTDHAVNLCVFFQFSQLESDYFLLVHLYERSRLKSAKEILFKRLSAMRQKADQIAKRIHPKNPTSIELPSTLAAYYADFEVSLIHLATSSSSTQTAQNISRRFGIPLNKVQSVLSYLVEVGLVSNSGSKFEHSGKSIHLERASPFTRMNHLNWRLQAVADIFQPKSIHYTNVFTIGQEDVSYLRENLLQFIESQSRKIASSGSDELSVFCCDLFSPANGNR